MNSLTIPRVIKDSIMDSLLKLSWEKEGKEIIMKDHSLTIEDKLKLKFLITIGTPSIYRSQLWLSCSGAKEYLKFNPTYYNHLYQMTQKIISPSEKQINADLLRSQKKEDSIFIETIRRILTCYSIRNSSIGYCQGFNFIVEKLFTIINNEEETFWVFSMLIEDILPINYYSELAGIIIDTTMIGTFLQKYFPLLNDFFIRNDLGVSNFIHKWLVTLFTENFLDETTYFIWDFLFLEGNIVLIKACLSIFCALKTSLMQYDNNMEELFFAMINQTKEIKNNSITLIHALSLKQFEFDDDYLEQTRFTLSLPIIDNINKDNEEKFKKKMQMIDDGKGNENNKIVLHKKESCNVDWPFCIYEGVNVPSSVVAHLVMNHKKITKCYDNYFFNTIALTSPSPSTKSISTKSLKTNEEEDDDNKDIIIERRPHYCILKEDQFDDANTSISDNSTQKGIESIKEFKLYRRMSKDVGFITVKELLKNDFKPKPYLDDELLQKTQFQK